MTDKIFVLTCFKIPSNGIFIFLTLRIIPTLNLPCILFTSLKNVVYTNFVILTCIYRILIPNAIGLLIKCWVLPASIIVEIVVHIFIILYYITSSSAQSARQEKRQSNLLVVACWVELNRNSESGRRIALFKSIQILDNVGLLHTRIY